MGGLFSAMRLLFFRKNKIVFCGLDNAGKTTVLYRMLHGDSNTPHTAPTVGFNVENLQIKGLNIQTWDLGGQELLRTYWPAYMTSLDALVYVIDATDHERLALSKRELFKLVSSPVMDTGSLPLLLLLNKVDLPNPAKVSDMEALFEVEYIRERRPCRLFTTSCKTGHGLNNAFHWLVDHL
jgi:small GTP-binding protein